METKKVLINYLKPLPKKTLAEDVFTMEEFADKRNVTRSAINMRIRRVVIDKTQKWEGYKAYARKNQIVIIEVKTKTKNHVRPKK